MTKSEWKKLRTGHRVKTDSLQLNPSGDGLVSVIIAGTVTRFNSNASQAEVLWDGGTPRWEGRLRIEYA